MRRALKLALKGAGWTSPNPMVGAVVALKSGTILGEGYHRRFGAPHAEVEALRNCDKALLKGASLYVNLEPCCHHGKTPPCADALIEAGLSRVVIAMQDPNPMVSGKGIDILQRAGVKVEIGLGALEAFELNRAYVKYHKTGLAWCHIKIALSLDGKIADHRGRSKYFSGAKALKYAHLLRSQCDAILVGRRTIEIDDPQLNVRLVKGRNPIRLVLSAKGQIDREKKVFAPQDERAAILLTGGRRRTKDVAFQTDKIIFPLNDVSRIHTRQILVALPRLGILSVLVEGGAEVLSRFMQDDAIDELTIALSPTIIGKGLSPFETFIPENWDNRPVFKLNRIKRLGEDVVMNYRRDGSICSPD